MHARFVWYSGWLVASIVLMPAHGYAQSTKEVAMSEGREILTLKGVDLDSIPIDLSRVPLDLTPKEREILGKLIPQLDPADSGESKMRDLSEITLHPERVQEDLAELEHTLRERGIFDPLALPADPADTAPAILQRWNEIKLPAQPPPPAITALASSASESFAARCGPAAKKWAELRSQLTTLDANALQTIDGAAAVIRGYVDNCLSTTAAVSAEAQAFLDATVGVLTASDDPAVYRCTATRLSANSIVTARHCLFRMGGTEPVITPLARLKFTLVAAPNEPLSILDVRRYPPGLTDPRHFDSGDDRADWAVLEISPSTVVFPAVSIAPAAAFDQLRIYSFQTALAVVEKIESRHSASHGTAAPATPWQSKMRIDLSPTCLVAATVLDQCFIHACQSDVGSSGAPVFRVDASGKLTLVGVHIRHRRSTESGGCASPLLPSVPNIAVAASAVPAPASAGAR